MEAIIGATTILSICPDMPIQAFKLNRIASSIMSKSSFILRGKNQTEDGFLEIEKEADLNSVMQDFPQ